MQNLKNLKTSSVALLLALFLLLVGCNTIENFGSETDASAETESRQETVDSSLQEDCNHKDKDNDGVCDDCQYDVIIEIALYAINDLHGKLLDSDSQPGVDELTTYLREESEKSDHAILFSSGDMWQGSAESGLTRGNMMTEWMNEMDFAFMTLGNHEFDWGDKYIEENATIAEFPFLAINVYDSDTNAQAEFCESSLLMDLGELQIGFIGAIGDCYSSIAGDMSEGYYFLTGNDLSELVMAESQKLRGEGADFIVYSLHDSTAGCDRMLTAGGYVDIVFEGHSHSSYVKKDDVATFHIQGGGENSGLGYAEVAYNIANGNYTIYATVIKNQHYAERESDDIVNKLMEKYAEEAALLNASLGRNDIKRSGNELRQIVANLYAALATERWSEYPVVLGGGYLSCRSPGRLDVGEVRYGDLYMLFPFDNRIALCTCSGADLLRNYINSSNENYFVGYTEYGQSIIGEIDPNKTYYLITDSYNYTYARNNLTVVEYYDEMVYARDLMADHIRDGGLLRNNGGEIKLATIKELLELGKTLQAGASSLESFYVEGVVASVENTKYGNLYIEDEEGNQLYIYGVYQDGVRYDAMSNAPKAGDHVKLLGNMKHYVNRDGKSVYEIENAELVEVK